jgi:hypothetical protein
VAAATTTVGWAVGTLLGCCWAGTPEATVAPATPAAPATAAGAEELLFTCTIRLILVEQLELHSSTTKHTLFWCSHNAQM